MNSLWITDYNELRKHELAWEALVRNVSEPNVFYEPWMALPALKFLGGSDPPGFLMIYDSAELKAIFPIEVRTHIRQLRFRHLSFWRHRHCYLCTPLIRKGYESVCTSYLLNWWENEMRPRCHLFYFDHQDLDGPFMRCVNEAFGPRTRYFRYMNFYERAMFRRSPQRINPPEDLISRKHSKNLRRLRNKLAELGHISYVFPAVPDAQAWIHDFLELEASGWKGKRGTALKSAEGDRKFALEFLDNGIRQNRVRYASLYLNEALISTWIDLAAGDGAFTFKIAYDESYARYSPTTLLLLEHLKKMQSDPAIQWIDTCAGPDQRLVNRLFRDRRRIAFLYVADRPFPEGLAVLSMAILSRYRRLVTRMRNTRGKA